MHLLVHFISLNIHFFMFNSNFPGPVLSSLCFDNDNLIVSLERQIMFIIFQETDRTEQ
jgi:hypothetical protein